MNARLLIIPGLAALVGCSSASPVVVVTTDPNGSLSFTYSGTVSGTFSTSGTMPATQIEREASSWAAGVLTATSETNARASIPAASGRHTRVSVIATRQTVGSSTIGGACSFNCDNVSVYFELLNGNAFFEDYTYSCYLTNGTITITEVSATRVKGTFSGTGECVPPAGTPVTSFTVTSGAFDLPVVDAVPAK